MDVDENERDLFFEDKSNDVIQDDVPLVRLPQRVVYGHQAFLIAEARTHISDYAKLKQSGKGETARTNWLILPLLHSREPVNP